MEHYKTKAMVNKPGEVEVSSFIETEHTTLQLKEVWHFPGERFVVLSIKICPDHWVTLFLHLILFSCGNISSKLDSFGRQETVELEN